MAIEISVIVHGMSTDEIPKSKHHLILKLGQINPKFEITMTETNCSESHLLFEIWIFGHWILFVICDL